MGTTQCHTPSRLCIRRLSSSRIVSTFFLRFFFSRVDVSLLDGPSSRSMETSFFFIVFFAPCAPVATSLPSHPPSASVRLSFVRKIAYSDAKRTYKRNPPSYTLLCSKQVDPYLENPIHTISEFALIHFVRPFPEPTSAGTGQEPPYYLILLCF